MLPYHIVKEAMIDFLDKRNVTQNYQNPVIVNYWTDAKEEEEEEIVDVAIVENVNEPDGEGLRSSTRERV